MTVHYNKIIQLTFKYVTILILMQQTKKINKCHMCPHTPAWTHTHLQKISQLDEHVSLKCMYKESMPRHMVLYVVAYNPLFAINRTRMMQHMVPHVTTYRPRHTYMLLHTNLDLNEDVRMPRHTSPKNWIYSFQSNFKNS